MQREIDVARGMQVDPDSILKSFSRLSERMSGIQLELEKEALPWVVVVLEEVVERG